MPNQSWRMPTTFDDWLLFTEKRLTNEERRPVIAQASDLLGPGAGPRAMPITDWSSPAATFTGVYHGSPDDLQINSPDDTKHWIGETFGTVDGFGFQRLTQVSASVVTGPMVSYARKFISVAEDVPMFGAWRQQTSEPPFAGSVSINLSAASTGTGVIPFPAGRFASTPVAVGWANIQTFYASLLDIDTTQVEVRVNHRDGTSVSQTVTAHVIAVDEPL